MASGPRDHDADSGESGHDEQPLPKLEPDPNLIGKTLVGSGAPEPRERGRRREARHGHEGR